LKGNHYNISL